MIKYWVYILYCKNDTYYTGYTTNIHTRYRSHLDGSGKCKYTRSFKPIRLAQCWVVEGDKSLAMKIERFIKKLTRADKLTLIKEPVNLCQLFPSIPADLGQLNQELTLE